MGDWERLQDWTGSKRIGFVDRLAAISRLLTRCVKIFALTRLWLESTDHDHSYSSRHFIWLPRGPIWTSSSFSFVIVRDVNGSGVDSGRLWAALHLVHILRYYSNCHILVFWSDVLPVKLTWLSSVIYLIGGGQAIGLTMVFVVISDISTDDQR